MSFEGGTEIDTSTVYPSAMERLASYIRSKRGIAAPYVLLLGAGASTDSGYPDGAGFVKRFLELCDIPTEYMGPEEQRKPFDRAWDEAGPQVREALMKRILPPRPPSPGYVALTKLIASGAFDIILSLNPDNLLEQALADQRFLLRSWSTLDAMTDSPQLIASRIGSPDPRIKIVKLHGDFRSGTFAFMSGETHEFKARVRDLVQQQLLQDVISFGTALGDQDIRGCLSALTENTFWFVSRSDPDMYVVDLLQKRNSNSNRITGPDAEFDRFFPTLLALVERTSLRPESLEAEFGGLGDRDLSRIYCIKGPYGHGGEGIFLGSPDSIGVLVVRDVSLIDCRVNMRLRIADHGGDESNWVGCQVRANSPQFGDGFLVYLRATGNVDVYSRLPGFVGVIETAEHAASAHDVTELELEIQNNKIEVLVNGRRVIELEDPNIVGREGYIYLLSHFTKSYFSHLRVSPL